MDCKRREGLADRHHLNAIQIDVSGLGHRPIDDVSDIFRPQRFGALIGLGRLIALTLSLIHI